jgi:hypothetical protein
LSPTENEKKKKENSGVWNFWFFLASHQQSIKVSEKMTKEIISSQQSKN